MARLDFFSGTAPDCLQVAFAFNDGRIILVGPNLGGLRFNFLLVILQAS
jgi:hypothetical protein